MKLYELVNLYHVDTELSCAEAIFKACDEYYDLNLPEEARKMFSVMGNGMQSQRSCCGALTAAVGVIGALTAEDGKPDINNLQGAEMIAELVGFVEEAFGSLQCADLQRLEIRGFDNACHAVVEIIARKLEEILDGETEGFTVVSRSEELYELS